MRTRTHATDSEQARSLPLVLAVVGPRGASTHPLPSSGVVVGRDPGAGVQIDDDRISRRHVVFHIGAALHVEDLGSRNGTRVAGVPLAPAQRRLLAAGEPVEIGPYLLVVRPATPVSSPRGKAVHQPGGPPAPARSAAMKKVYELLARAAAGKINVLLLGETGVGKDVLARELHRLSSRRERPLVSINCAAISEQLLESELFGHEKGAFTGAAASKAGLLETAEGGASAARRCCRWPSISSPSPPPTRDWAG